MVADVTVVAQQEPSGVGRLPAGLAHGALETPPALAENHVRDLEEKRPACVVHALTPTVSTIKHTL